MPGTATPTTKGARGGRGAGQRAAGGAGAAGAAAHGGLGTGAGRGTAVGGARVRRRASGDCGPRGVRGWALLSGQGYPAMMRGGVG